MQRLHPDKGRAVDHRARPAAGETDGYFALISQCDFLGSASGLPHYRVRRLLNRYGSLIDDVLRLADDDPTLLEPLAAAPQYLRVGSCTRCATEAALHLEDLLARRTRISISTRTAAWVVRPKVADLIAPILGWTQKKGLRSGQLCRPRRGGDRVATAARRQVGFDACRPLPAGVAERRSWSQFRSPNRA